MTASTGSLDLRYDQHYNDDKIDHVTLCMTVNKFVSQRTLGLTAWWYRLLAEELTGFWSTTVCYKAGVERVG